MKTIFALIFGILAGILASLFIPVFTQSNSEAQLFYDRLQGQVDGLKAQVGDMQSVLPREIRKEVNDIFPLQVQYLGDQVQLTTSTLPEELSTFLTSLSSWPQDDLSSANAVVELRQRISASVNQIPAPRRQRFADQIVLAEWSLNALDLLSSVSDRNNDDLLVQLVLTQSLLETVPYDASRQLVQAVADYSDSLTETATIKVRSVLEDSQVSGIALLRSSYLLADWMSQADLLVDDTILDQLEVQLDVSEWFLGKGQIKRAAFNTQEEFDVARQGLVADGSVLVESAVNRRVALPNGFIEALQGFSKVLVEEQREAQRRQHAEYQLWAISNIREASKLIADAGSDSIGEWLKEAKEFPDNSHFTLLAYLDGQRSPRFRSALLEAAYEGESIPAKVTKYRLPEIVEDLDETIGWKNQSGMAKALTADALIQHLLIIDEAYLDRPVAAIYGDAFQKAWIYLEGTALRIEVAQTGATISKKVPGDDLED